MVMPETASQVDPAARRKIFVVHGHDCKAMERPGYIFEVANADHQRMLTTCIVPLEVPFDWSTLPIKFRIAPEQQPRHSAPLPPSVVGK